MPTLTDSLRRRLPASAGLTCPMGRLEVETAVNDPEAHQLLLDFRTLPVGQHLSARAMRAGLLEVGVDIPEQTVSKHRRLSCSCTEQRLTEAIASAEEAAQ